MTKENPLSQELNQLSIENIYIYVGDAVRYDHLSSDIAQMGTTIRTIASSTTSAPSFSSLLTGQRPHTHGVYTFKNQLRNSPSFLDISRYNSAFLNSIFEYAQREHQGIDPIYPVLGISDTDSIPSVNDINTPFMFMERGPGGHLPYGNCDSISKYFDKDLSPKTLKKDYKHSIKLDADLFKSRLNQLRERGLLEDTLVIYTSDHGELLGEGGLVGHNSPMCPELVYVPTVFISDEIPERVIESQIFRHIDILPTLFSILDLAHSRRGFEGQSITNGFIDKPSLSLYRNEFLSDISVFGQRLKGSLIYEGVWDAEGGYTFPKNSSKERLTVLGGKIIKSPKRTYIRSNLRKALSTYLQGKQKFRSPSFSESIAKDIINNAYEGTDKRSVSALSENEKERLKDLGYL